MPYVIRALLPDPERSKTYERWLSPIGTWDTRDRAAEFPSKQSAERVLRHHRPGMGPRDQTFIEPAR